MQIMSDHLVCASVSPFLALYEYAYKASVFTEKGISVIILWYQEYAFDSLIGLLDSTSA
jgi:hypothetical protein